jgi:hypothetical protein
MNIPGVEKWIPHLTHPMVVIAFTIMIFSIAIITLKGSRNKTARNGLFLLFILVIGVEVIGAIHVLGSNSKKIVTSIKQESQGAQSPNIQDAESVTLNYGKNDTLPTQTKSQGKDIDTAVKKKKDTADAIVTQKSTGPQSPNISKSKNVKISY